MPTRRFSTRSWRSAIAVSSPSSLPRDRRSASDGSHATMSRVRIALANLRFPGSPDEAAELARNAVRDASRAEAAIVCFPECYVPGYRGGSRPVPPPDGAFLERAWSTIADAAGASKMTVILGTERLIDRKLFASAVVIAPDGSIAGFQDKVQLDPSEERTYTAGGDRSVFRAGEVAFGIVICHEGWRYPETV